MRCPSCGSLDTQVKDSRPTEDSAAIRRRRVCLTCNFRFTTFERVQLRELIVIKRNGRRVPFDRDKLMRSLSIALRKRPVEPERVEQMVSKIVRELESLGESEVSSETIGETVMEHLRDARRRGLCAVCLGLPQFPRAQGFRAGARGADRRGRSQARRSGEKMNAGRGRCRRRLRLLRPRSRARMSVSCGLRWRSAAAGSATPGPIRRSARSSSRTA